MDVSRRLIVGFLFSGIVHDLGHLRCRAAPVTAASTAFFLVQSRRHLAGAIEVRATARPAVLAGRGWAFTMLVLVGPMFLLFHPPFVRTVVKCPFLVDWLTGSRADV